MLESIKSILVFACFFFLYHKFVFDDIIDKLPAEYKVLIDLFYKQDYTRKEIAEALVLTEMAVNRRLKRAFELIADLVVEKNNKKEGSYNGILH